MSGQDQSIERLRAEIDRLDESVERGDSGHLGLRRALSEYRELLQLRILRARDKERE